MNDESVLVLETRHAAKVLLWTDRQELVFVAGKRGMLNLPGGGIDTIETVDGSYKESSHDALYRELHEELGLYREQLSRVAEVCGTWDTITPEFGLARRALWSVFTANLCIPARELIVPPKSEITEIETMTPQNCLAHSNMSKLAKHAVRHILDRNDQLVINLAQIEAEPF